MQRKIAISVFKQIRNNAWVVPDALRPVIERSLDNEKLNKGDRVRHKKFGEGTVMEKSYRGDHLFVAFDEDKSIHRRVELHTVERI